MKTTYQLHINVNRKIGVSVGRLGLCSFPAGRYVYTGSAKAGLEARIARHRRREKKLHWHIDYLLSRDEVDLVRVTRASSAECACNQAVRGEIVVPGFGSSDCRQGCGSHLKKIPAPFSP